MSKSETRTLVLAGLLCLTGLPAQALEWQADIGVDARWFDWREHLGDRLAVMESGPVGAAVGRLQLNRGRLFTSAEVAWGGGIVRYNGHLQGTPAEPLGEPYDSDAWEEIVDAEWRLGWLGDKGRIHFGYLQRDWNRYIDGSATVASADERYRWRFVTFGGEAPLFGSPEWQVALNLGIPTQSQEKVYAHSHDDATLEPGAGFFWRLSFPFRPADRGNRLSFEPYFQQHTMQASDPVTLTRDGASVGRAMQPASVRRELGVTLRWRLGAVRRQQ